MCCKSGDQFWKESPGSWCGMEIHRYQPQGPVNILCLSHFTLMFKENFSPGKLGGSRPPGKSTTLGGRAWGWEMVSTVQNQMEMMLLETRLWDQMIVGQYNSVAGSWIVQGMAHVLSTELGTVVTGDVVNDSQGWCAVGVERMKWSFMVRIHVLKEKLSQLEF